VQWGPRIRGRYRRWFPFTVGSASGHIPATPRT
jgi:hypothetical protein